MHLHKSEKAKHELGSRQRELNVRERGALFLADGYKTQDELQGLLRDDGSILQKLISDGYLVCLQASSSQALATACHGHGCGCGCGCGPCRTARIVQRQLRRQTLLGDHPNVPV